MHYICKKHGNIGKVSSGCGDDSFRDLADVTQIRAGDKKITICSLCYLEFIKKQVGEAEIKA